MKVVSRNIEEFKQLAFQKNVTKLKEYGSSECELFRLIYEPVVISRQLFDKLKASTSLWHKLTHEAAYQKQLIFQTFKNCKEDPLVGQLLSIYEQFLVRFPQGKPSLDLMRSDYFIESETNLPKIIQYNTHSTSMAWISHQFQNVSRNFYNQKHLEQNKCLEVMTSGVIQFYQKQKLDGVFLIVTQKTQKNIYDQKFLLSALEKQGINVQKVNLDDLNECVVDQKNDLYYQGQKVAVVYFRAGYSPSEHNQQVWKGKRKAHLSNACCIPSIGSELVGQKRMQAELSKPHIYSKFFSEEDLKLFKDTIIQTWDLNQNDEQAQKIIKMMEEEGEQNFVLKPNAEGGMNNFFGKNAYEKFRSLSANERPHFILTRRIFPHSQILTFIGGQGQNCQCETTHEFSVYGSIFSDKNGEINHNLCDGFLIRTKPKNCDECGLLMGKGALAALEFE